MASSEDNGKQIITFCYQQEGTAESFNKILHGVLPRGVISGGELRKVNDSKVTLDTMQMLIGDNNVTCHVETTELAECEISYAKPYIVATYAWENMTNSYVKFQSIEASAIAGMNNPIILGKGVFSGASLLGFDYTRKSWTAQHYYDDFGFINNFNTYSPSFNVISDDNAGMNELKFIVEKGRAIINGKIVELTSNRSVTLQSENSNQRLYFQKLVNQKRIDIIVLNEDGSIDYIMGEDSNAPIAPTCPSSSLILATVNLLPEATHTYNELTGDLISYEFNHNYYKGKVSLGKKVGNSIVNPHTLYF